jgi:hypothetical protein
MAVEEYLGIWDLHVQYGITRRTGYGGQMLALCRQINLLGVMSNSSAAAPVPRVA